MIPKILIIPDVHGRTFWKDAINKYPIDIYPDLKIIFLGDYLDPYVDFERISKNDAYDIFNDILYYAKNDNRIQLLIGNHDWHYFVNCDNCRIDKSRERNIEHIFKDNMDMFSLVKIIEVNNKKYMFTHAGITLGWLKSIMYISKATIDEWVTTEEFPIPEKDPRYIWMSQIINILETNNYEILNECLKNYDENFYNSFMSMISHNRGGWNRYGSLIWADVNEHLYSENHINNFYQIFAHSLGKPSIEGVYINDNFAMLDNRHAWVIDDNNNLTQL